MGEVKFASIAQDLRLSGWAHGLHVLSVNVDLDGTCRLLLAGVA